MQTEQILMTQRGAPFLGAQHLKDGHLIVCPTDTVYGIAANAFDEEAIAKLYTFKQRPLSKGIPLLLGDVYAMDEVVAGGLARLPAYVMILIDAFMPGALTLVLPKAEELPANLSPNNKVAVRIPDHDLLRVLIRSAGGAVAVTSANLSGQPPARTVAEAMLAFKGQVPLILDGGLSPHSMASTIIDCTLPSPQVVRVGAIAPEVIMAKTGIELRGELPA